MGLGDYGNYESASVIRPTTKDTPAHVPASSGLDSRNIRDLRDQPDSDPTNPEHYSAFTIEPIDAIESWGLGYNLASVVAYIARAGRKPDGIGAVDSDDRLLAGRASDLRKALRYLVREITGLDGHPSWDPADIIWGG